MKKGKKHKKVADDLPVTQSSSQVVVNVKPVNNEYKEELPGYEKSECSIVNDTNPKSVCWNCCHDINEIVLSQPIKYEKGVFKTLGCFCSYPCIARYIIDSNEPSDVIFSRLSTLNLYVNMLKNTKIDRVKPAPPRLSLKMFGGTMDIDEYRNNNEEYLTVMNIDPIVCCIDVSTKKLAYKKKNIQENKKEFKLYRRNKKKNTNDIYASMNLISE